MPKSTTQFVRMMAVLMLAMSLLGLQAFAQSTTDGAIGGTVTDQTGAVIPNATVKVTNTGTNATASRTTDGSGRFRVISLQPGTYALEISAGNFAAYKAQGLIVEVGRVTTIEAKMSVSASAEAVDVTGEAPTVNTQSQDFTSNINQTDINELPINGRRWSQYALGTPGATPDGAFGLVSFRGISGLLNNNTVDGGDNNNAFYGEERGRTRIGYVISQDAIQEFQVNTSNFSAEYGRAAGAVVNAVTKSGTNKFHGSGFWYVRNDALNAYNPFSVQSQLVNGTSVTVPIKPPDQRYQFGASVGGPIIKDKLFFFFSWDQQRRNFPGVAAPSNPSFFNPITVTNPTSAGKVACPAIPANGTASFNSAYDDGNRLFCYGISQAQSDAAMAYLNSLTGQVTRRGDQLLLLPKIDWKINDKHSASIVYNRLRWFSPAGIQTQAVVSRSATGWGNDGVKTDSGVAKLNSTLTNTIANEVRLSFGRDYLFGTPQTFLASEPTTAFGLPPGATVASQWTIGTATYIPRLKNPVEWRYQAADTISWSKGKHLFKFGADYNRVIDQVDSISTKYGSFSYTNRSDFITDFSQNGLHRRYNTFAQAFGLSKYSLGTNDFATFLQDDWRIHPRFTLNLGLRYEVELLPNAFIGNPLVPQTYKLPEDLNNFGPRVGFAWDPTGNGKTAIRGGWGMYYGRFLNSTIASALTGTGTSSATLNFSFTPSSLCAPQYPNVNLTVPTCAGSKPDVTYYGANQKSPLIQQGDFSIEREIAKNTSIGLSFLASAGSNLPQFVDRNLPLATVNKTITFVGGPYDGKTTTVAAYTGARPNVNVGRLISVEDAVSSDYRALVVQFNRKMSHGLQLRAHYTWSSANDNGQTSQTFASFNSSVYDPQQLDLERGRSNFSTPHRFVANLIWQPQYFNGSSNKFVKGALSDWSVAPIILMSSNSPYTAGVSGSVSGCPSGLSGINCSSGSNRVPFIQRNTFDPPAIYNVDLRLSRRVKVKEWGSLELLAESFNLFNHVNVVGVNGVAYRMSGTNANFDPTFGIANSSNGTLTKERQMQFAVRFQF
jgi:Carboxypeptidase regulatory-like domain/TonB dependent receptor